MLIKWRDFDNLSNVGCGNALFSRPRRSTAETNHNARNDRLDRLDRWDFHHGSSMMFLTASMSDFICRELTVSRVDSFGTTRSSGPLRIAIKDH